MVAARGSAECSRGRDRSERQSGIRADSPVMDIEPGFPAKSYLEADFLRLLLVAGTSAALRSSSRLLASSASLKVRKRAMFSRTAIARRSTSTKAFFPSSAAILRRFALAMLSGEGSPDFLLTMFFPSISRRKPAQPLGRTGIALSSTSVEKRDGRQTSERLSLRAHSTRHRLIE